MAGLARLAATGRTNTPVRPQRVHSSSSPSPQQSPASVHRRAVPGVVSNAGTRAVSIDALERTQLYACLQRLTTWARQRAERSSFNDKMTDPLATGLDGAERCRKAAAAATSADSRSDHRVRSWSRKPRCLLRLYSDFRRHPAYGFGDGRQCHGVEAWYGCMQSSGRYGITRRDDRPLSFDRALSQLHAWQIVVRYDKLGTAHTTSML